MRFIWPELLWLLLMVPALLAAYIYALRRKKKVALRYASLMLPRVVEDEPFVRQNGSR